MPERAVPARRAVSAVSVILAVLCVVGNAMSDNVLASDGGGSVAPARIAGVAEPAGLPRIGVSAKDLYFEVERLGPIPNPLPLTIYNESDVGILQWSIFEDRSWLSASPGQAWRNETDVLVWLVNTDPQIGVHTGHLVISSTNAVNSPETVFVHLNMLCPIQQTGDVNDDGQLVQSDIIYLVSHLLRAGPPPRPVPQAGDVNCDRALGLGDVIYLVNYLFKAGPSPCNACSLLD